MTRKGHFVVLKEKTFLFLLFHQFNPFSLNDQSAIQRKQPGVILSRHYWLGFTMLWLRHHLPLLVLHPFNRKRLPLPSQRFLRNLTRAHLSCAIVIVMVRAVTVAAHRAINSKKVRNKLKPRFFFNKYVFVADMDVV